jgi:hypothetical protein
MGSAIEGFGSRMGSALDSVINKVADVGIGLAKWGAVGLFAGAAYGVGKLNAELETATISLAAIFKAGDLTSSFAGGMTMASDQVSKMKRDVMTLPGTFNQLAALMQTTATTGIAGGMDADALRKFAGRTMLTASIVAPTIDNNLLSKEIVNLMAGKAGTHNILGLRLGLEGDKAKKFNALSDADRIKELNALYDKYADATTAIAGSWKAILTSFKDNALFKVVQPGTEMLFSRVKEDLIKVNTWVENNQGKVEQFARLVGSHLANAWERATLFLERHEQTLGRIVDMVSHIGVPNLASIGEKALPIALGVKLLPAALSGGGSMIGGLVTKFGGLATGAEEAGVASVGAAGGILTLAGAAAAAAVALGAIGTLDNLSQEDGNFHKAAKEDVTSLGHSAEQAGKLIVTAANDIRPAIDGMGSTITHAMALVSSGLVSLLEKGYTSRGDNGGFSNQDVVERVSKGIARHSYGYQEFEKPEPIERNTEDLMGGNLFLKKMDEIVTPKKPEQRNFGTTIQKVEIVVKGSDDPSRVAKSVLRHFQDWQRNRTTNQLTALQFPTR